MTVQIHELTLPLDHEYMPDEVFPTATPFVLPPRDHPDKGFLLGTETGTCLTLPAQFEEQRRTTRLHEVPPEKLMLRETAVLDVPAAAGQALAAGDVEAALAAAELRAGDAVLLRTGWGDSGQHERPGPGYLVRTPHLTLAAAERLAGAMTARGSDLLLTDMATIAWPDQHLMPECLSLLPRPRPWPAPEAAMYLHLYTRDKMERDYAAALVFARAGIMTVKRLVHCGALASRRVHIVVAPLKLVRGVGSTCRVVAIEGQE
jgi:kynurenine formamidase